MPLSVRPFRRFPIQCDDWTHCGSKAAWIHQVITKRPDLDWYWIDDDMSAQEKEAYSLPAHRCIQVSESFRSPPGGLRGRKRLDRMP